MNGTTATDFAPVSDDYAGRRAASENVSGRRSRLLRRAKFPLLSTIDGNALQGIRVCSWNYRSISPAPSSGWMTSDRECGHS